MKTKFLLLIVALCIFSCNTSPKKCAKYKGQDLLKYFNVEQIDLNDSAYEKYIRNEGRYNNNEIDLKLSHDNNITTISFLKLGGYADINCVEVIKEREKLNIVNYESNYLKEITIRKIEYKLHNPDKLKLGKIDFKFFE